MNIKDLVVTGIVKFLKSVNIDTLVVEKLNEVTKNELDTLHGVTSNIQDQFSSVSSSLETAELEQTNWKTRVASAINAIPKKNPTGLTKTSALVKFESELKNTQDAIEGATAVAANVLSPKKYVGSNGYLTDGTMPDRTNQASQWVGYEDIIVQKHPQDPANQVLITITNTKNNYYGFYDNTSTICANMYLPADKIAYGVRVGRCPGSFGADDTNTILGTFTGDANATASDILSGKSAYVRGLKINGNIPDNTGVPKAIQWCRDYNGRFEVAVDLGYYGCSWNENSYEYLAYSQVASAIGLTAGKIIKGNTILGIAGTGQTGVDTSDANATASDILSGKSAYVKGRKISGSIVATEREPATDTLSYWYPTGGIPYLCLYPNNEPDERYYRIQRGIRTPASNLGNADASDVLKGKTFTSINGLRVVGTIENMPSQTSCESIGYANGICYIRIPVGAYLTRAGAVGADNGYPEIYASASMFGDAEASHVLTGKLFTSSAGFKATGTMPNRCGFYHDGTRDIAHGSEDGYVCGYSTATSHWGVTSSENYYFIRMPSGYYGGWVRNGQAEVEVAASVMNAAIGLTADRIKEGVTIAGVTGTLRTSTGTNTSDATAYSGDIREGKSAYARGSKIWGSMIDYNEYCRNLAQTMRAIKYCGYTSDYVHIYYVEPGATKVHEFNYSISNYHTSWDGKIFYPSGGLYTIPNYNWCLNSGITISTSEGRVTYTNNESTSCCGVASVTTSDSKNHIVLFIAMR